MKRTVGIAVRSGVWIATAAMLVATFLFVRLLVAPIDLGMARNLVVDQTKTLLPGWDVTFETAEVGWDWRRVRPWVALSGLQFIDRRDRLTAFVPEARVTLAMTNLFTKVAISDVDIERPRVHISNLGGFSEASEGGQLSALFSASGKPTPEILRPVTEAFSRFGKRLLETAPALNTVTFSYATVEVERGADLDIARFAMPRMALSRRDEIIRLDAILDARLGEIPTLVRLQGQAEPNLGDIELTLGFSELRPSVLADYASLPEAVGYLNVPLALDLTLDLSSDVGLRTARFAATMDEGAIIDPVSFPEGSAVQYGTISGRYEAGEDTLVFDLIEIATEGPVITGEGLVYWTQAETDPAIQFILKAEDTSISDVLKYWPIKTYPDGRPRGARAWIDDHIIKGIADNVRFEIDWTPEEGGRFENKSPYRLTFDFNSLDTHYLLSMPPILNSAGRGVLTHDTFTLELDDGYVGTMPVTGTTARMVDIDVPNGAQGFFDISLHGPVPEFMELLSYPPLNLPQKLGFEVDRLGGQAVVRTRLTLPLIKDIPVEAVRYDVSAHIAQTRVNDLMGGEGLRQGDITLMVDPDKLSAQGTGTVNGVPLTLVWRENLKAGRESQSAETTEIVLSGTMDEHDLAALGVDVSDYLVGQTLAEANFIGRNFSFTRGYFSADVSTAVLKEKRLSWTKPASVPATVTGTIFFEGSRTRISPLVVEGEGIDVNADISFHENELDAEFIVGELGGNSFKATARQDENGALELKITGDRFNLGPILSAEQAGKEAGVTEGVGQLTLDVDVSRLLLLNGEELDDLRLHGDFIDGAPSNMTASALIHGTTKETLLIVQSGDEQNNNELRVTSPDGGHFLRALGLFSHLRDGHLELSGTTSGWGRNLHIRGEMSVKNAFMVPKSKLGPAVTEGVIEGLNNYLKDDAVQLDTIEMPFDYTEGVLDITAMKANGPSLGMTMEGQISARSERININGVFVPAYGLNSLLGKIPLLGNLLTGGEGKGIFGVTYRVKGPTENPEFSINPLSGIAPGFLRLLFEGRKGKLEDIEIPEETPEASDTLPAGQQDPAKDPDRPQTNPQQH